MKALTVQQPWADAVLKGHIKFFMEPFAPKVRGYFMIHAGLSFDWEMENWLHDSTLGLILGSPYKRAAIIGYARLTSVLTKHPTYRHPRRSGHFVFQVTDINWISLPIIAIGKRGFWPLSDKMMRQLNVPQYVLDQAL